jgi:hypothetical protein
MLFDLHEYTSGDANTLEEIRSEALLVRPKHKEAQLRYNTIGRSCPEVTVHYASKCMNRLDLLTWKTTQTMSFFKMLELYRRCPELQKLRVVKSVHLCEAPGNFIDACVWLYGADLDWHAMSLRAARSTQFYPQHLEAQRTNGRMRVHAGEDGLGDISHHDNVKRFSYDVGASTVDLITADGNVVHKEHEEAENAKLIASEIVCAVMLLRPGGSLVLRMFDMDKPPTINMIWFLTNCFTSVKIVRLEITEVGAADRYVVCSGFQPLDATMKEAITALCRFAYRADQFTLEMAQHHRPSIATEIRFYQSVVGISRHNQMIMEQARALAVYLESINITTSADVAIHIKTKLLTSETYNQEADTFLHDLGYE